MPGMVLSTVYVLIFITPNEVGDIIMLFYRQGISTVPPL